MFAVFGVTRGAARMKAEKMFKPFHVRGPLKGQRKDAEEMAQELSEGADHYFDNMKPQQLSCPYESFQAAIDYIECTKNVPARNVHICKRVGNGINPKTRKEKLTWVNI